MIENNDVNETANPDETTSQPAAQCEDLPINILKAGRISRATQTDELPLPSVNKTTQTIKYKQRISKKHCKTIGLQTSMATTLTSSVDSKKRKFKQVELEEDDIRIAPVKMTPLMMKWTAIMIQMMTMMITPAMKTIKLKKAKWSHSVTDRNHTKSIS